MPIVKDGLVEYTSLEKFLMRDKGLCVTCDFGKTCSIYLDNLRVMGAIKEIGDSIEIIVKSCSAHTVQGVETYGVRGK